MAWKTSTEERIEVHWIIAKDSTIVRHEYVRQRLEPASVIEEARNLYAQTCHESVIQLRTLFLDPDYDLEKGEIRARERVPVVNVARTTRSGRSTKTQNVPTTPIVSQTTTAPPLDHGRDHIVEEARKIAGKNAIVVYVTRHEFVVSTF